MVFMLKILSSTEIKTQVSEKSFETLRGVVLRKASGKALQGSSMSERLSVHCPLVGSQ